MKGAHLFPATMIAATILTEGAACATSRDVDFGGQGTITSALEASDLVKTRLELIPSIDYSSMDKLSLLASARARVDLSDDLLPGKPDLSNYAGVSRPLSLGAHAALELRDMYLQYDADDFLLRIGKQQIVWGQLDGYKLLDQVNPQSFEEFILEEFDQSRIGLWALNVEFEALGGDLQLIYSPDTTVSFVPVGGALFAPLAPR